MTITSLSRVITCTTAKMEELSYLSRMDEGSRFVQIITTRYFISETSYYYAIGFC